MKKPVTTPSETLPIEGNPHDAAPAIRAVKKRNRADKPTHMEDGQAPLSEPAGSPPVLEEVEPEASGALPETQPQKGFPIVGIGASAGGWRRSRLSFPACLRTPIRAWPLSWCSTWPRTTRASSPT